jgi:hypothetical protein
LVLARVHISPDNMKFNSQIQTTTYLCEPLVNTITVYDELIKERFGVVDYLFDSHYKDVKNEPEKDFFDVATFPQLANLKDLKVEIKNKKD